MPSEGVDGAGALGVPVPGALSPPPPPPPPQAARAVDANSAVSKGAWALLAVVGFSGGRGRPSGASATAVVRVSSYGCVMVVVVKKSAAGSTVMTKSHATPAWKHKCYQAKHAYAMSAVPTA